MLISYKEHHPALPTHSIRVNYRVTQALWFLHNSPHYERLMQPSPRLTGVQPVIGSGPKEPHHYYCAIGLTRACLLIRQPLIREHAVSPRWGVNADKLCLLSQTRKRHLLDNIFKVRIFKGNAKTQPS
ncbi:hypothetical protein AVEN_144251-1 [Araneus ventricosus]|uniref:Uncharacterized protein n=1 Tax=Araneus ventricosus TaxID=182803 RepID=A0A4Y2F3P5_ARAVE|nr:hypothetical protein AVEN_247090-1 [Araneus ventricosus]GBM35389.1 hypothetical protein AVEN_85581-1 [Araneus ventricosus]GBM35409.1 hypothetical protein AVEN_133612-1 [Araneus ventricosus]GBM35419.1 hypothetical protein AVEN_144251-1 [Araneus ventricosus]